MNGLLDALGQLAREKDIPYERLLEQFQKALAAGYKKHAGTQQEVTVEMDKSSPLGFRIYAEKTAVERVGDSQTEISLEEAREIDPETELNDIMEVDVTPDDLADLGRIAAQTVKQIMTQGIRDIEREIIFNEYIDRVGEIVPGVVQRTERGNIMISIGKGEAILPRSEQMRGENCRFGDRLEVYILRVEDSGRNPQVVVSRSHPNLLRRLFEREVPEIHDGVVEIVHLAREAGAAEVIDPNADGALRALLKATGGGVAAALDFVGAGPSFAFGLGALRKEGRLVSVGLLGGSTAIVPAMLALKAVSVVGSYVGSLQELQELMAIARRGVLPELPVTPRPLADANATLDELRAGQVRGRNVLRP